MVQTPLFLNNLLPPKFDDKTLTNTLMSELANEILVHLSGCKHLELEPKDCSLPEKELKIYNILLVFVSTNFQGILLVLFTISIV